MTFRIVLIAIAVILVQGCSGHGMLSTDPIVLTKPELVLKKSSNVMASPPLAISVVDEQANEGMGDYASSRTEDYMRRLQESIVTAYPNAIASGASASGAHISVEIRIHRLGAYVNRSGRSSMLGPVNPQYGNIGDWGAVIMAASDPEQTVSGTRYLVIPSNWSGVTNIDISLIDNRPNHTASFHFPILSERIRQGDLGLLAAHMVADSAWDNASARIAKFLDAAISKVTKE